MALLFLQLFWSFFCIGLFGFGGGYAMISMIQGEVVNRYHWMTMGEFTDIVAVSQSTPGPIGINSATYVGYTAAMDAGHEWYWGLLGSVTATVAVVLPSLILMLIISKFLMKFKDHPVVEHVFQGLRPAAHDRGELRQPQRVPLAVLDQCGHLPVCLHRPARI